MLDQALADVRRSHSSRPNAAKPRFAQRHERELFDPVMLLTPLLGEAATISWAPWRRMATVFEPIRPVPPMTTIFMGTSVTSEDPPMGRVLMGRNSWPNITDLDRCNASF
jgi:hypothetical protein